MAIVAIATIATHDPTLRLHSRRDQRQCCRRAQKQHSRRSRRQIRAPDTRLLRSWARPVSCRTRRRVVHPLIDGGVCGSGSDARQAPTEASSRLRSPRTRRRHRVGSVVLEPTPRIICTSARPDRARRTPCGIATQVLGSPSSLRDVRRPAKVRADRPAHVTSFCAGPGLDNDAPAPNRWPISRRRPVGPLHQRALCALPRRFCGRRAGCGMAADRRMCVPILTGTRRAEGPMVAHRLRCDELPPQPIPGQPTPAGTSTMSAQPIPTGPPPGPSRRPLGRTPAAPDSVRPQTAAPHATAGSAPRDSRQRPTRQPAAPSATPLQPGATPARSGLPSPLRPTHAAPGADATNTPAATSLLSEGRLRAVWLRSGGRAMPRPGSPLPRRADTRLVRSWSGAASSRTRREVTPAQRAGTRKWLPHRSAGAIFVVAPTGFEPALPP